MAGGVTFREALSLRLDIIRPSRQQVGIWYSGALIAVTWGVVV